MPPAYQLHSSEGALQSLGRTLIEERRGGCTDAVQQYPTAGATVYVEQLNVAGGEGAGNE